MTINDLLKEIKRNRAKVDIDLIKRAYQFAAKAHQEQKRENGENYINHPLNTALALVQMKLDAPSIAAALLHDTVDDTPVTHKEIEKEFGREIALLIEGVTKLEKIEYRGIERHVENLRKMFLAMAKDIRIILIKLADRFHNMQTLGALPRRKQRRIALETLEIYAPIAHRLGMGKLKGDLEDLAFPYVFPKEHDWLKDKIKDRFQKRANYLKRIEPLIKQRLEEEKINYIEIHGRAKRYYSLYKKLQQYNMDFSKIYDLMALRIIVPSIEECYRTLGVVHKHWKPLPGRIKDYIATPKANGYQSLHTTVFCTEGKITEIQIRTAQIHWEAEYGVTAHWARPKNDKIKYYGIKEPQLQWINEIKRWQKEALKPKEFLKSLKIDFFKYRIFILTPRGDVINLPEGATPVDFAYRIHTELGHRCGGAKADGKIIPLNQTLYNGQIVEILAKKEAGPNRKWLGFVKTNYAKTKIRNWFKRPKDKRPRLAISQTRVSAKKIEPTKEIIVQRVHQEALACPINIKGGEGIVLKLAKCCNPVLGEKIVGYITTAKHITVHYHKCHNILNKKNRERIIPVSWKNAAAAQITTIEVVAGDRMGLMKDIATAFNVSRINIKSINATEPTNNIALIHIAFEVAGIKQLNEIEKKLKNIKGIWEIKRVQV